MTSSASDHITTPGKPPAFQFYANDFETGTASLSAEEVGIYIRLLCYQWDKGAIPMELEVMSRIARVPLARMRRAWFSLQSKFEADPQRGRDYVVNLRLEGVRQTQIAYRQKQADNGKRGGRPKKPLALVPGTQPKPNANPNPNPNESSSSSVFVLQEEQKSVSVSQPTSEEIGDRARQFIEFYADLYPQRRNGVPYRRQDALEFPTACSLVSTWPDDRLRLMAEIFLRTDHEFAASGRRSIKQFAGLAEWCDNKLRTNGR